jgi:hypothetical protein
MRKAGLAVAQVVRGYGDVFQARNRVGRSDECAHRHRGVS